MLWDISTYQVAGQPELLELLASQPGYIGEGTEKDKTDFDGMRFYWISNGWIRLHLGIYSLAIDHTIQ